ncbi:MAG: nucleotide exchange factor GrpE [Beijerinckiaceae bacterium]
MMDDSGKAENEAAASNPDGLTGDAGTVLAGPAAQSPAGEPDPFVVLENLQLENAALKDKVLRALAEMENQRRRAEREVADAKTYGVTAFALDMLTFADNLRRAVESLPPDAREPAGAAMKTLIEGVELTERDFLSRLGKYGVKKLEPLGAKFDPNLHEALFEVPDEMAPNATVVQVIEDGYTISDRVLRPAKVGVSRGGPKPANENAPT